MDTFEVPVQALIDDLMAENRKLVLEASTLRAAVNEIRRQNGENVRKLNGGAEASTSSEE
jgi:hypothetical protein